MAIILRRKGRYYVALHSSQLRYAVIYVIITALALCFLNIYAANTSRKLVFRTNQTAILDRALLISSSYPQSEVITREVADQAVHVLDEKNYDRIVITDNAGVAIYDSLKVGNEEGAQFFLSSIVKALEGNDVFYSRFQNGVVECFAAVPIMYFDVPVGAVYLTFNDSIQGALLKGLESNIAKLSIVLAVAVLLFSLIFSAIYARRMRRIMDSIRIVREGEYSHKIQMDTHDEMEQLATEFNSLTDRLQESEQRRRQFVSDASHELKTPLASIKLLSDSILQNDMDDETVREFVGDIGNEADRLTRMSHKLLELTKLDAVAEEARVLVDIQEVARKVFRMLRPQMDARSIRLVDDTIPNCIISISADDLYQIIFNLVENGIKYNNEGGTLQISLERDEYHVTMHVDDEGMGIPADAIAHIFERFYRVDKARSRQAGGSGLGLSIVHDMVKRNFGSVRVENRETGGTRFTVVFPTPVTEEEQR